jgi:predicted O-methyltransferase YrrM
MTVDEFLRSGGFFSDMGYIGQLQKEQFAERLSQHPEIHTIAEIGFNAGHSAECFLTHCKNLQGLVSFDINHFPYTKPAAEYLGRLHPNRFLFIEGDSLVKVPEFVKSFPRQKFDLIYIDGNHVFEQVVGDIVNAMTLAHSTTIVWIDDYHFEPVKRAIDFCVTLGTLQTGEVFAPKDLNDPDRTWIEARYR